MVQVFEFRLIMLDDDSVIVQSMRSKQSHTLRRELSAAIRQLVEDTYPSIRPYDNSNGSAKATERSIELAKQAPLIEKRKDRYRMEPALVKLLSDMALFNEGVSALEISLASGVIRNTCSARVCALHANGYLKRVGSGKYLVSPEGHAYLVEQRV